MKKIVLLVSVLKIAGLAFSQNYSDPQNMKVIVEQDAHFPKGEMALTQYIFKNINYSQEAKDNDIEGSVMVSFMVNPDSSVNNIVILSGLGFGIDDEVKRLLSELKFVPAIENGVPGKENIVYNFPVRAH